MPGTLIKSKFNYTITIFWLIFFITMIVVFVYKQDFIDKDDFEFYLKVITGSTAFYIAFYTGALIKENAIIEKKKNSFLLLNELRTTDHVKIRQFIENAIKNHTQISQKELFKKITNDDNLYQSITLVLIYFEDLSIAIQENHVDEKIIYKSLCVIFPTYFSGLKGYIDERRKYINDQKYMIEAEKLHNKWGENRMLSSGKKLPNVLNQE